MARFRLPGGWLLEALRARTPWRHAKKKLERRVDRRIPWEIPLINPGASVSQPQLLERAERLRGAADEAARLANNLYLSFLLLGTYIAVIIGSTTDVQLLKISPVVLPVLNVQLPIVGFYVFVPWLLLLLYFNLLLHLTLLAQKLHRFDAVLGAVTDAVAREDQRARLFPFPFSVMLIGHQAQWRLRGLLGLMVWTTVLLLPLGLLLWAQLRFLPYHAPAITWNHRATVLGALLLLWLFWPLLLPPAPPRASAAPSRPRGEAAPRRARRTRRRGWTGLLGLTLVTVVFSWGIAVLPEEALEGWIAAHVPARWRHDDVFTLTFWLFETPGAVFHRNLRLQEQVLVKGEPSAKILAALRSKDENTRAQALDEITGLSLTNRDLRGADLRETLLAKGDLRGANLKGANLERASVFAGNLSSFWPSEGGPCVETTTYVQEVCQTNLQRASLEEARLQGADLRGAQLQGADLEGAKIGSADFTRAELMWSDLRGVSLVPLDEKTYAALKQPLTDAIRDEYFRADRLASMQTAVERLTNLEAAHSPAQVLCDDVNLLPSCLTHGAIVGYAAARAAFLGKLGCRDAAIARGVVSWHLASHFSEGDEILRAFAKRVTGLPEKECPGWAAVPADQKDTLRTLATAEPAAP